MDQGQFLLRSRFEADRINIQADRVDESEVAPAELSAACQSLSDAVNDLTFGTDVMLIDSPDLLRSAELLDGDHLNAPSAFKVEELILTRGYSPDNAVAVVEAEDGTEAAETAARYIRARSQRPSSTASQKYVVYLAQRTTMEMEVVRRSIDPMAVSADVSGWGTIAPRRADGSTVGLDPDWCTDL